MLPCANFHNCEEPKCKVLENTFKGNRTYFVKLIINDLKRQLSSITKQRVARTSFNVSNFTFTDTECVFIYLVLNVLLQEKYFSVKHISLY